jgi:hypothetical protein
MPAGRCRRLIGDGMEDVQRVTVVVLATHPLLGEGLARVLGCAQELSVTHVSADDMSAVEQALAATPDVVIVERNSAFAAYDLVRFAPDALLIDVGMDNGHAFTVRREEIPAQPDGILAAIRGMRKGALAPISALAPTTALALGLAAATGGTGVF